MSFASEVWDRQYTGSGTMSKNLYALTLTGFTALGIAFAAIMSGVSHDWHLSTWGFIGFAVAVLVVSVIGSVISEGSDNPAVSLFGYALVAGPFGLLLGPVVAHYSDASVARVFATTTMIVLVMGVIGTVIPESLEHWAGWLFSGLLVLLCGYFAIPLLGLFGFNVGTALTIWDWVGILLFSGLVIYDFNRAMRLPHTLDNAIDCACAVFLDFINIFIRLLSVSGDSD